MYEKLLYEATELKKESENTEQTINFINEQISELEKFKEGLKSLKENKEKEIIVNIGKEVYLKSKQVDNRLFINVGAGVIVKKNINEVFKIIDEQLTKFYEAKSSLQAQLREYALKFNKIYKEIEKIKNNK